RIALHSHRERRNVRTRLVRSMQREIGRDWHEWCLYTFYKPSSQTSENAWSRSDGLGAPDGLGEKPVARCRHSAGKKCGVNRIVPLRNAGLPIREGSQQAWIQSIRIRSESWDRAHLSTLLLSPGTQTKSGGQPGGVL